MIVEEYKCNSAIIKIDNEDILEEKENKETLQLLLSLIIEKISDNLINSNKV